jgi:hypothetical protein
VAAIEHETEDGKYFYTIYGHMPDNGIVVRPGDVVSRGDMIGQVGNEGRSTGAHLHLGVLQNPDSPDGRFDEFKTPRTGTSLGIKERSQAEIGQGKQPYYRDPAAFETEPVVKPDWYNTPQDYDQEYANRVLERIIQRGAQPPVQSRSENEHPGEESYADGGRTQTSASLPSASGVNAQSGPASFEIPDGVHPKVFRAAVNHLVNNTTADDLLDMHEKVFGYRPGWQAGETPSPSGGGTYDDAVQAGYDQGKALLAGSGQGGFSQNRNGRDEGSPLDASLNRGSDMSGHGGMRTMEYLPERDGLPRMVTWDRRPERDGYGRAVLYGSQGRFSIPEYGKDDRETESGLGGGLKQTWDEPAEQTPDFLRQAGYDLSRPGEIYRIQATSFPWGKKFGPSDKESGGPGDLFKQARWGDIADKDFPKTPDDVSRLFSRTDDEGIRLRNAYAAWDYNHRTDAFAKWVEAQPSPVVGFARIGNMGDDFFRPKQGLRP